MVKENVFTLIALVFIFALGCAIALEESSPEHWYGFIAAFSTTAIAITGFWGLGEWKRKLKAEAKSNAVISSIPICLESKALAVEMTDAMKSRSFDGSDSTLEQLNHKAGKYSEKCREMVAHAATLSKELSELAEDNLNSSRQFIVYIQQAKTVRAVVKDQTLVRMSHPYESLPKALLPSVNSAIKELSGSIQLVDIIYEQLKIAGQTGSVFKD